MTKATELREFASLLTVASGQIQFDTDIKISGDLITTGNTINITADTLNISDLNITLASGAANSTIADGAGITIDGADATLTYDGVNDEWDFNKNISVSATGYTVNPSTANFGLYTSGARPTTYAQMPLGGQFQIWNPGTGGVLTVRDGGNVGIGTDDPNATLVVSTNGAQGIEFFPTAASGVSTTQYYNRSGAAYVRNRNIASDHTFNISGATDDAVTIATTGKVGIGIASPDHSLDVDGAIATRQVRHSVAPILNLDFARTKTLDSRIKFSRQSWGTYYNNKGLIDYATFNEPRFDHDPATRECKGLLIESNETNIFNYTNRPEWWPLNSHSNGAHYYEFNSMKSPDGTYNATKIIIAGGDPYFYQNNLTLSGTYTWSFWIKAWGNAVGKHYTIRGANIGTSFNIAPSGGLPSEWTRITHTFTSGSTTTGYIGIEAPDNSPADGDELSIWGAQLELRDYASSYIPSNDYFTSRASRASYRDENGIIRYAMRNEPRYSHVYDGQKWQPTGLLLERAATNLGTSSENLSNVVAWQLTGGFVERDLTHAQVAPDGSNHVWAFIANTVNGSHNFREAHSGLSASLEYTISWWMKPKGSLTEFGLYAAGPNNSIIFSSIDGSSTPVVDDGGAISVTCELEPSGWYRCVAKLYASASGVINPIFTLRSGGSEAFAGNGSDGLYFWGYQVERGTAATSYIRTEGSSGTRSTDVATSSNKTRLSDYAYVYLKDVENYDPENWTLLHNIESFQYIANSRLISLDDNTLDNRIAPQTQSTTQIRVVSFIDGDSNVSSTTTSLSNWQDSHKYAFGIGSGQYTLAMDGSVEQDAAGAIPIRKVTQLRIGGLIGGYTSNGCHRKVTLYPEKMTNAELVALTENN